MLHGQKIDPFVATLLVNGSQVDQAFFFWMRASRSAACQQVVRSKRSCTFIFLSRTIGVSVTSY
jgi:hypothetical protein